MDSGQLIRLLSESVARALHDGGPAAIAYSGGLDSSVVAALASRFAKVTCYGSGTVGSNDAEVAERSAREQGLDFVFLEIGDENIIQGARIAASILSTDDPLRIAYIIPVAEVIRRSSERKVLAGNGADELFGGYAKYLSAKDPQSVMSDDLEKMLCEASDLAVYAGSLGKTVGFPFASEEVVAFARRLPLDRKIDGGVRKVVLRDAAKSLGLLSHDRPKKAAQYSSGILKAMERRARTRGLSVSEWVKEVLAQPPEQTS